MAWTCEWHACIEMTLHTRRLGGNCSRRTGMRDDSCDTQSTILFYDAAFLSLP